VGRYTLTKGVVVGSAEDWGGGDTLVNTSEGKRQRDLNHTFPHYFNVLECANAHLQQYRISQIFLGGWLSKAQEMGNGGK